MRVRAVHFACLLLLFSTLGIAEAPALQDRSLGAQYVQMLLQHGAATDVRQLAVDRDGYDVLQTTLPAESVAQAHTVWAMRAPSAQSAAVYATTSFGR